jgi:aldose sugar dehydrogenase
VLTISLIPGRLTAFLVLPWFATLFACAGYGDSGPANSVALQEADAQSNAPGAASPLIVKTLFSDLREPWGMDFLPDGRLLVTEKSGALSIFNPQDWQRQRVTNLPASAEAGQGGLMDVLVHPDFEQNGWLYLSYTVERDGLYSTRVSRFRLSGQALVEQDDLFTAQPFFEQRRHFGSRLLLDGGYLYITVGDRGNRDLAQSLETHNGKVMRLLEDGSVPADNPFIATPAARPEIWTYGHRNPQGIARHPHNGAIWLAEHGPQGGDEVNVLTPGHNYGWPLITYGEEYGGGKIGRGTHGDGLQQPLVYWLPSIGAGNIDFYTGDYYPGWENSLLVAGLKLTRISRLELDNDGLGRETRLLADLKMRIRDVQVGPDGLVYALAGGSRLIRLQ